MFSATIAEKHESQKHVFVKGQSTFMPFLASSGYSTRVYNINLDRLLSQICHTTVLRIALLLLDTS
jgi:hypothetical protein